MNERQFQDQVIALAILYGWHVVHYRPAMMPSGRWMTALQGHSGAPDLIMVHEDRGTIFAELKADKGRLAPDQVEWLRKLDAAGNEVYVWRPKDIHFITKRLLSRHAEKPAG